MNEKRNRKTEGHKIEIKIETNPLLPFNFRCVKKSNVKIVDLVRIKLFILSKMKLFVHDHWVLFSHNLYVQTHFG